MEFSRKQYYVDHFLSKLFTITHPSSVALHSMTEIKGRGIRNQIANTCCIIEKAREFQKNICFIDYTKTFNCVDHNKLENSLRDENARPPDLPPEKFVCMSRSSS